MTLKLWLAFVAASAVLLVTPGPTILTVIGYSVSHGRRARAALIAAVALGDSTALAVSLLGLGAVLQTSAFWFSVVKFVGGLYLLYLGIKLLRAGGADAKTHVPETPDSRWRLFVNTYLVTALNPKGIVFFVAFLPQFIHPGVNAAQQLLVLACTFVAMAIIIATAATLHANGKTDINSAADVAEALKPIAGNFAFVLFSLGIVGTGLLSIPVLAGSAAYAFAETQDWICWFTLRS